MHQNENNRNIMMIGDKVASFTDLGGYPLLYVAEDGGCLCSSCVQDEIHLCVDKDEDQWYITAYDVNWEDSSLYCDNCSQRIESAYAEDEVV